MATRWKNTLKSVLSRRAVRALLFLGAVAAVTALCVEVYFCTLLMRQRNIQFESLVVPTYLDSQIFRREVGDAVYRATQPFQSDPPIYFEDTDLETLFVHAFSVADESRQVRSHNWHYEDDILVSYRREKWSIKMLLPQMISLPEVSLPGDLTMEISFWPSFGELSADTRMDMLTEAIQTAYEIFQRTPSLPQGLLYPGSLVRDYYVASDARSVGFIPNGASVFPRSAYHIIYENEQWDFGTALQRSLKAGAGWPTPSPKYDVYLTLDETQVAEKQQAWGIGRALILPYLYVLAALGLLLLLLLILLCIGAGRTADSGTRRFFLDRVWGECHLTLLCAGLPLLFTLIVSIAYSGGFSTGSYYEEIVIPWTVGAAGVGVSVPWLAVFLSLVRQAKDGRFFTHSLIGRILRGASRFLRALVSWRPWAGHPPTKRLFRRQLVYICLGTILGLLVVVVGETWRTGYVLVFLALMLPGTVWYVLANRRTYREITRGFDASLAEQLRAEKMKTALVTNVSHDLKTPLTSLIGYIELLSREETLSDTARDYVSVLAEKAERLRHLLVDLFDLSKSTSGDIALELETLDLKKLVEQTVADMRDRIDASSLILRLRLPEHPVELYADGRKLYRVLQNLLDNALKYAQPGTRVYVDLEAGTDSARILLRNTAGYEMNFTKEEILQRFARGDASRTTEGSGLGLSIAESFARLCGGRLDVDIDGDLFKVTVTFAAQ
ncbi:MAG: HAMP domain-containing histidine kinase [Oscillospiraceae bacterium]|nr:HAMP domain-containing histidine kinase [Oscillospiraceae bacterium]